MHRENKFCQINRFVVFRGGFWEREWKENRKRLTIRSARESAMRSGASEEVGGGSGCEQEKASR